MKRSLKTEDSQLHLKRRRNTHNGVERLNIFHLSSRPWLKFDLKFPFFRKPSEVGCFSIDERKCFNNNRDQMKFYVPAGDPNNVDFNLRLGYKELIKKDEEPALLNNLLRWIQHNLSSFRLHSESPGQLQRDIHTDFVCWRGLLTKLLCTPYENRDGWKISICFFNNTYYLCEYETEQKIRMKAEITEKQDEMSYWGWKFEQYVTSDADGGLPNTSKCVNNNEEFCVIVRSRLNGHSLVYGGETDAAMKKDSRDSKSHSYIEFKTTREIETPRQKYNFQQFKLIKWWAQSFLVGIKKILCGFRDDDGIVHRLETFNTEEIPELTKELRNPWKPNVCFNFLDQFLTFIKDTIRIQNQSIYYLVEWEPGCDIRCQQLRPDSSYEFLPSWYTAPMSSQTDSDQSPTKDKSDAFHDPLICQTDGNNLT